MVVPRMAAPGPADETPMATHVSASAQEIPVKSVTVAGIASGFHVVPPFVVTMMLGEVPVKSLTA